jgi:hypothetical protein
MKLSEDSSSTSFGGPSFDGFWGGTFVPKEATMEI